jgi:membrane-associated phospholipid phosphatase
MKQTTKHHATHTQMRVPFWKAMAALCQRAPWFVVGCILWWVGGGIALLIEGRESLFLNINHLRSSTFDPIFAYGTKLGEGLGVLLIISALLLIAARHAVLAAFVFAGTGLLTILTKQTLWPNKDRPYAFFEKDLVQTVEGAEFFRNNSFPSGHTITAFAMFGLLALMYGKRPWVSVVCFLAAIVVAWSRMYLGQHFYEDVWVGSMIGFAGMLVIVWINEPWLGRWRFAQWRLFGRKAVK